MSKAHDVVLHHRGLWRNEVASSTKKVIDSKVALLRRGRSPSRFEKNRFYRVIVLVQISDIEQKLVTISFLRPIKTADIIANGYGDSSCTVVVTNRRPLPPSNH